MCIGGLTVSEIIRYQELLEQARERGEQDPESVAKNEALEQIRRLVAQLPSDQSIEDNDESYRYIGLRNARQLLKL